jgi:hypothetical protein
VSIDGRIWHGCHVHGMRPRLNRGSSEAKIARNIARDRENDAALEEAGWAVIHVGEHENAKEAASRIAQLVLLRRGVPVNGPRIDSPTDEARGRGSRSPLGMREPITASRWANTRSYISGRPGQYSVRYVPAHEACA